MKQCFADISAERRNAAYVERAEQEYCRKERFSSAPALHIVEVKPVQIHIYDSGADKQHQLYHRMIDHVQHGTASGNCAVFSEKSLHRNADEYEADL